MRVSRVGRGIRTGMCICIDFRRGTVNSIGTGTGIGSSTGTLKIGSGTNSICAWLDGGDSGKTRQRRAKSTQRANRGRMEAGVLSNARQREQRLEHRRHRRERGVVRGSD